MLTELNDPTLAVDAADLIKRAERVPGSNRLDMEFNFPAGILMLEQVHDNMDDWWVKAAPQVNRYAELMMMQLAFVNEGSGPATPFIIKAYEAGWRYRLDKGFHRPDQAFTLSTPEGAPNAR